MLTSRDALLAAFWVLAAGALLSLLVARARRLAGWLAFVATAGAAGLMAQVAIGVLRGAGAVGLTIVSLPRWGSVLRLHVDGLSAVFLLLIALLSTLAALYSIRYMDHYTDYGVGRYYPSLLLFVAGMFGIVVVTDLMVFFCLFWQLMTIPSFLLVRYEHRRRENVRAAWRYLAMMELSCALVMGGAFLLAGSGPERFDFDAIGHGLGTLLAGTGGGPSVTLAFALFLVGFGIKAGMWPLGQLWLPGAHPAAPSPVSALLSGVMLKTGVYGLLRSFLWLVPAEAAGVFPSTTWGLAIAGLGTVTLFVGTMQALRQDQTKRLLAFSSIGQVGYILLGLGACLSLLGPGTASPAAMGLAALALYGALFHTINHATFKGLLFLNAGSMLRATDEQDLNRMGGLMRYMPLTALTCLVASLSIAGVPGFNGFASKWSLYVATILGSQEAAYLALFGVVAILTSALTLIALMKLFGMAFLSRSSRLVRERAAERSLEVPPSMQLPQLVLAGLCLLLGLVPALAIAVLSAGLGHSAQGLASLLASASPSAVATGPLGGVVAGDGRALLGPGIFAGLILTLMLVALAISRLGGAERRAAPSWLCGYAEESEATRYRAHGMYGEIKRYFGWVGGVRLPSRSGGHAPGSVAGGEVGKVS